MRVHLATKTPGASAFALPERQEMVKMLQEDLAVARDLWLKDAKTPDDRAQREHELFLFIKNESGEELVFHSLRHTTGAWLAMRGVEAKVIQSVMRHCNITLTFDTDGHLIAGAESAAIQANADMIAAPTIIAAAGTDACVSFLSQQDAKPCVEAAGACEHGGEPRREKVIAFKTRNPEKTGENATSCESVRDITSSAQGGDRTRTEVSPRRILSPEGITENVVKTGVSEQLVAPALPLPEKQLDELLSLWRALNVTERLDVLNVARGLHRRHGRP